MKKIFLVIVLFSFSCQEKQKSNQCLALEQKNDSLLKLTKDYKSSPFYKFYEIYKKEKQSPADTILIPKYQSIIGTDEIVNLYIDARINTISQIKSKKEILNDFTGTHFLKPRYKNHDRYVTSIKISNDSCFIFKDNDIQASGKIELIYSKNNLTPGTFNINSYLIKLVQPNLVLLRDRNCLHCSSLEFYKVN